VSQQKGKRLMAEWEKTRKEGRNEGNGHTRLKKSEVSEKKKRLRRNGLGVKRLRKSCQKGRDRGGRRLSKLAIADHAQRTSVA